MRNQLPFYGTLLLLLFLFQPGQAAVLRGPLSNRAVQLDAETTVYEVPAYSGLTDHPWQAGLQAGSVYVEDFQDAVLNLPMLASGTGAAVQGNGVPGDGGAAGWTAGVLPGVFTFTAGADGWLPRYAGLALNGAATVRVFDAAGQAAGMVITDAGGWQFTGFANPSGFARLEVTGAAGLVADHLTTGWLSAPDNDHFAGREDLGSGSHAVAFGSIEGATKEYNEPSAVEVFGTMPGYAYLVSSAYPGTRWWTWTAAASGPVQVSVEGGRAAVYTGASLETLEMIAPGLLGRRPQPLWGFEWRRDAVVSFDAVAGVFYQIEVAPQYAEGGVITLRLGPAPVPPPADGAPANDEYTGRIALPSQLPLTISGTTAGSADRTVWYEWQAPADGYVAEADGTRGIVLYHIAGNLPGNFVDQPVPGLVAVQAQRSYAVSVSTSTAGPFQMRLVSDDLIQPLHDTPETALVLSGLLPARAMAQTYHPEREPQTIHPWWKWTATENGVFEFDFSETSYQMTAEMYAGMPPVAVPAQQQRRGPSRVTFEAQAGQTYWFRGTFAGGPTRVHAVLRRSTRTLPPNDHFAAAIDLGNGPSVEAGGAVELATSEPGEPALPAEHTGTLWWHWRCPAPGDYQISALWPGSLDFYTGSSLATLVAVPGASLRTLAAGDYHIRLRAPGWASQEIAGFRIRPAPLRTANEAHPYDLGQVPSFDLSATASQQAWVQAAPAVGYWKWTAPGNGRLLAGPDWQQGTAVILTDAGVPVPGVPSVPDSITDFPVTGGHTYLIRGSFSSPAEAEYSFRFAPAPGNDHFAAAQNAGMDTTFYLQGSLLTATTEPSEPAHGNRSLWWTWTAPRDGLLLSTAFFYEGNALESLVPAQRVSFPGRLESWYSLKAGHTYRIAITSSASWWGDNDRVSETMVLYQPAPLAGDTPATAQTLLPGAFRAGYHFQTINESMMMATSEGFTHQPPMQLPDTWWCWTASAAGVWQVNLSGGGTLLLYRDENGSPGTRPLSFPGTSAHGPSIAWRAAAGESFYIAVGGDLGLSYTISTGLLSDGYQFWALSSGLASEADLQPGANPSGDGFPNLIKFALGMDPLTNSGPGGNDPAAGNAPELFVRNGQIGLRYRIGNHPPAGPLRFSHSVERGRPDPSKPNGMDWDPKPAVHLGDGVYESLVNIEPAEHPVKMLRLRVNAY